MTGRQANEPAATTGSGPAPGRPPLSGLRVLDFTRVIAGPYLTAMLADLGCDVIKVESPQHGDDSRTHFPPGRNGEAAIFVALNRSKRSAVIDLATEEGRSLARELAAKSDILVENFRPGAMQRLGLDYESLREINPRLIYCAISGYGYTGKFRDLPGYDPITQAETGYMYMTGDASMPPIRAGGSVVDIMTGMHAALAIVSAVHARSHTGMGQFIDAPLFDTALSALGYMLQGPLLTGVNPQRLGNTSFFMAPNGLYDAADGKMMISCGNDRLFARLCSALGADDMPSDPRFATNAARLANLDAMNARMSAILAGETRDYWIERLRQEGVPAGSVRSPLEALASEETAASGMLHEIDHPLVGRMSIVGSPLHFSDTPAAAPRPSPGLDQHTDEVLAEVLGLDSEVIARLRADRHIGRANPATKKAVSS